MKTEWKPKSKLIEETSGSPEEFTTKLTVNFRHPTMGVDQTGRSIASQTGGFWEPNIPSFSEMHRHSKTVEQHRKDMNKKGTLSIKKRKVKRIRRKEKCTIAELMTLMPYSPGNPTEPKKLQYHREALRAERDDNTRQGKQ